MALAVPAHLAGRHRETWPISMKRASARGRRCGRSWASAGDPLHGVLPLRFKRYALRPHRSAHHYPPDFLHEGIHRRAALAPKSTWWRAVHVQRQQRCGSGQQMRVVGRPLLISCASRAHDSSAQLELPMAWPARRIQHASGRRCRSRARHGHGHGQAGVRQGPVAAQRVEIQSWSQAELAAISSSRFGPLIAKTGALGQSSCANCWRMAPRRLTAPVKLFAD